MTTLFDTLVGAALGTAEMALPRPRPRFAPLDALPVPEPMLSDPQAMTAGPASPRHPLPPAAPIAATWPADADHTQALPPTPVPPPQNTAKTISGPSPTAPLLPPQSPAPVLSDPVATTIPLLPPQEATATAPPPPPVFMPIPAGTEASATPEPTFLPGASIDQPSGPDAHRAPYPPQKARATPPPPPPAITIHIGRIEVSAPAPPRPPPTPAAQAPARTAGIPRAGPRQSLDSYLAGRRR